MYSMIWQREQRLIIYTPPFLHHFFQKVLQTFLGCLDDVVKIRTKTWYLCKGQMTRKCLLLNNRIKSKYNKLFFINWSIH